MMLRAISADWIIPVSSPPIKGGTIVYDKKKSRILFVGGYMDARQAYPNALRADYCGKVIMPGFVNAHTHLDFSLFRDKLALEEGKTMFDWIANVILRQKITAAQTKEQGTAEGIQEILESQTAVIGDIVHELTTVDLLNKEELYGACFHEVSGFLPEMAESLYHDVQESIQRLSESTSNYSHFIAPHSPYAVSEELLRLIAQEKQHTCFHLAESDDEVTFLLEGEPKMEAILMKLKKWNDGWVPPGCSPVRYFAALGLLHEKSIAVHMVKVEEKDYEILQRTSPNICLCPRSNVWLRNGLPPAKDYLDLGLNVCLGTDGLGSNTDLSLLEEMRFVKQKFPNIDDEIILNMGTINGAKALGMDDFFGTLEEGKSSKFAILTNGDSLNPYDFLNDPSEFA